MCPRVLGPSRVDSSECYQFVLEYLRELPIELCRTDMEGFVPEAKKLLAVRRRRPKPWTFARRL